MSIEGALTEFSVQDILQHLELGRKTGVLTVRSEGLNDEAFIHLDRGDIVFVTRRRAIRRFGRQLVRVGKLTQRDLDRALEFQQLDPGQRLGEVLLEMGVVAEEDLVHQLNFQFEESLHDIMSWSEGRFRFEERGDLEGRKVEVRVSVESLLMEHARRADELARIASRVPSLDAIPLLTDVGPEEGAESLDLTPADWEILAEIDADRDLRQISADLGRSSFDVAASVAHLVEKGVVEVREPESWGLEVDLEVASRDIDKLIQRGELEAADKYCNELRQRLPDCGTVFALRGRVMAGQGLPSEAMEAFVNAVREAPRRLDLRLELGVTAIQAGDLSTAIDAWRGYLRLAPDGRTKDLVGRGLDALVDLSQVLAQVEEDGDV